MVDEPGPPIPARPRGVWGIRVALIALGVLLGLLLIWRGTVVIGVVILAIALLRAVMVYRLRRFHATRREYVRARLRQRRGF